MVGVIKADIIMHDKPQGRGYVVLRETGKNPWGLEKKNEFPAHEFHYSSLENLGGNYEFAFEVLRGHGINAKYDGLIYKNLLAGYSHLRNVRANPWTSRFANFVRNCKQSQSNAKVASGI